MGYPNCSGDFGGLGGHLKVLNLNLSFISCSVALKVQKALCLACPGQRPMTLQALVELLSLIDMQNLHAVHIHPRFQERTWPLLVDFVGFQLPTDAET